MLIYAKKMTQRMNSFPYSGPGEDDVSFEISVRFRRKAIKSERRGRKGKEVGKAPLLEGALDERGKRRAQSGRGAWPIPCAGPPQSNDPLGT